MSWEPVDDGGMPIIYCYISYRTVNGAWSKVELMPDVSAYTIVGLKCGTQYIVKMSCSNRVGDGQATDEINIWTKGKSNFLYHAHFSNGFLYALLSISHSIS